MEPGLVLSICRQLRGDRCLLGYSGHFPDAHSARLVELAEALNAGQDAARPAKGRLGYVLVEAYQNIIRHRVDPKDADLWNGSRSLFLLRHGEDGQRVVAQNAVTRPQMEKLETMLAALRDKDNAQLKALFLKGIQRTSQPGVRGAGLGLIEMVRRSGGRFSWDAAPIDDQHLRFMLTLDLAGRAAGAVGSEEDARLRKLMMENRVSFCYAGEWYASVQEILLGMADRAPDPRELLRQMGAWNGKAGPALLLQWGGGAPRTAFGGVMDEGQAHKLGEMAGADRCLAVPVDGGILAMVEVPQ